MSVTSPLQGLISLARHVLLAPVWAVQLATGAKSFKDHPLISSKRLNRAGLHRKRVGTAAAMAAMRRRRLASRLSPDHRAAFERDGFIIIEQLLDPAAFAALRTDILAHAAPAREMVQGDTITRRIAVDAGYLRAVPALRRLIDAPRWRAAMHYVASFASEPLYYIQTIQSQFVDAPPDPQTALHADTFHATMKAWFFLNDVAADEGPLMYVPGSHRATPARLAWEHRRSLAAPDGVDHLSARGSMRIDAEDLPTLGLPPPRAFAVRANTLVVADTFGFHARGPSARPSERVEIWAYLRRNPFLPVTGMDLLSLPGLAERRIPAMWALRDRLQHLVGQPWRFVGQKQPLDGKRVDL